MTGKASSLTLVLALLLAVAGCRNSPDADLPRSAYTGQESRTIKALSAQEVSGYLEGQGMGFSKVAELNQHPGPKHVLELAEELGLTESQHRRIEQTFQKMRTRAQDLGRQLVEKEQHLDSTFASGSAEEAETEALLREIGELKARLRFTHVQAHLQTEEMLSPDQVRQYDELRGYGTSKNSREQHGHQEQHGRHGHGT